MIGEIVREYHPDLSSFLFNLTALPNYDCINYTEKKISRHEEPFTSSVQLFATQLWYRMSPHLPNDNINLVKLESCDYMAVIVAVYFNGESID